MKKFLLFIITLTLCLVSCSSEKEFTNQTDTLLLQLNSSINTDTLTNIAKLINTSDSRSSLNDSICKDILTPMIEDGKLVQEQIIKQYADYQDNGYNITNEDIEFIQDLTEDELAMLSFIACNLNETPQSRANVMSCLGVATGLTAIRELSVGGIVSAATVRQALLAIGKRYLGYIGVAVMVYEFVECING